MQSLGFSFKCPKTSFNEEKRYIYKYPANRLLGI